jgi:uncharacterized protein YcaQ
VRELNVSAVTARRVLLARQGLLKAPAARPWREELTGPAGTLQAIERLGAVQVDPVAVVERTHHLSLYARVKGYRTAWFDGLFAKGQAFEYLSNARCVLPMTALPDFWPIMKQARRNAAERRAELAESIAEVLRATQEQKQVRPRELGSKGPRLMGVGYNAPDETSKATGSAIDLLWLSGELFVSQRQGAEKWYASPQAIVPPAIWTAAQETDPLGAAPGASARPWATPAVAKGYAPWTDMLMHRYLQAYGLADPSDFRFGWQKLTAPERRAWLEAAQARGEVVPVRIDGVRRLYWAPADAAEEIAGAEAAPQAWAPEPEVHFLPPLDSLLWHRPRLTDLFDFNYVWEVYIPPAKRQYGAYTMPILEGDRLIGRIDPRLDRARGCLIIQLLQLEPAIRPDRSRLSRLARALRRFARFHGVKEIEVVRTEPEHLRIPL